MGLFSRARRVNGTAVPVEAATIDEAGADTTTAPAAAPAGALRVAAGVKSLRDALQHLYSIRPARDAFADEAVKLIAKSASVRAVALLSYESRGSRTRLLAQIGLDAEAAQTLNGDSMVSGWDIPLRSLRNRRINVIESAHENPFVPHALVAISPKRLTIATLPFFHANAPIGVVVLFSPTARGFADGLLKTLSQALRVCALALNELPAAAVAARPVDESPGGPQPSLLRGLAALKGELARLTGALEEAERQRASEAAERVTAQSFLAAARERGAQLEEQLAELRATGERLPEIEGRVESLTAQLSETTAAAEAARHEIEQLQTAVAAKDEQAARTAATVKELTAARAQVEQELESARAEARQHGEAAAALRGQVEELTRVAAQAADLRAALATTESAHSDSTAHAARVQAELQATQSAAETERGRLTSELAALQRELATAHGASATLDTRLAEQTALAHRLGAERQELLARIDALAAGGQSLEHERQAAITAAQQRTAELEAEIGRLSAALDAARNQATDEITRLRTDAKATLDGLRVELAAAVQAREEAQHAFAGHDRALADAATERTVLQRAHDEATARLAALEADLSSARDQHRNATDAQLAADRAAREHVEQTEARYQDEIAALRDRLAVFEQEQSRLAEELADKQMLLQSAEATLPAAIDLAVDADDDDAILDIDRDSAPGAAASSDLDTAEEAEADAAADECVVLDDSIGAAALRRLLEFGHHVNALEPTADACDGLRERSVACAAVNLAAPNAWGLLRHLRNGSGVARMPLVGYALPANAPRGFWLGALDVAFLPVAQIDLVAILNRLVPKVKRVIAMSNDIDVMSDVRNQLTRVGISTAVVLDGRQALDLVPTIRPEAAVLHVSPSCADVFRAVAGLRGVDISRDIPIVFLLDAEAQPREDAFLSAGLRMLTARGSLEPDGLVDALAAAFDGCRAL